jgi:bifunctional non-homologous end joining protein LigD
MPAKKTAALKKTQKTKAASSKKRRGSETRAVAPAKLLDRLSPPMKAVSTSSVPANPEEWIYEVKFDGFRALSAVTPAGVEVWSRNRIGLRERFPRIGPALEKLGLPEVVLDGEIVASDEGGIPRFELVQQGSHNAILMVFDVLWLEGEDLRGLPIEERRETLEKLFRRKRSKVIQLVDRIEGDLGTALRLAADSGHEGLIGKKKGSKYEPRRSRAWIKLKVVSQQEFAIVGYTPLKDRPEDIGALLLAIREGRKLRYAGKVGTGFSAKDRGDLRRLLEPDRVPKPAVEGAPRMRDAVWVAPKRVGEVRFTEWTADGMLRHPSFLGLRDDKSVGEITRDEDPVALPERSSVVVRFTSPDRVLYPRDGITKRDLAEYYTAVAEPMIEALRDRPLAQEHWNQGIDKPSWFEQELPEHAPKWLSSVRTPTRSRRGSVRHLIVDRVEALQWLAQNSVLTIHAWSARAGSLETPDWLIIDLDPPKGKGIETAVEAALVFRKLFESLEIPSVPKTSGKRGIHIFVPLAPGYTHEQATDFACRVCGAVAAQVPGVTVERTISKRKGALYADCLQNGYGKTVVAPYSPRALDGAPVSAPLAWSEVTRRLDPLKYTIRTMPKRLEKKGDLFAPALGKGVKLPELK